MRVFCHDRHVPGFGLLDDNISIHVGAHLAVILGLRWICPRAAHTALDGCLADVGNPGHTIPHGLLALHHHDLGDDLEQAFVVLSKTSSVLDRRNKITVF